MMVKREELEKLESNTLADYAVKSKDTRGRMFKEPEHPFRTAFQRDRDRIIHSNAFRRLEYKTQVFVNHEGDYYRTRLTHTLEVAQIARTIARSLRLNEDLVEAIALAHDLGHTPFGHAGEEILHKLMKKYGGFEHNLHGLRVVDYLEERYADFPGLNLSWEVREGIIKHATNYDQVPFHGFPDKLAPSLEAQVVDAADEIAYDSHDLDDGITSGLIDTAALAGVELWTQPQDDLRKRYPKIKEEIRKYQTIKSLINIQVQDIIEQTAKAIEKDLVDCPRKVKEYPKLVVFSKALSEQRKGLRQFLNTRLYQHYKVIRMSNKAKRFIQALFECYVANPEQLPPTSRGRLEKEGAHRVVCDYIAGMTDRYAQKEYSRLFQPYEDMLTF